jgi:hypothetical protein
VEEMRGGLACDSSGFWILYGVSRNTRAMVIRSHPGRRIALTGASAWRA